MGMNAQGEQYGDNYKYGNAEFGGGENMKLRYGEIPLGEPEAITPGQSSIQGRVKYGAGYRGSSYQYDTYSRLEEYTDRFGNTFVYGYDQYSRLHTVTYPNSVVTTYSYDSAGRLDSIVHSKGGQTLKSFTYQFDANGNITKITRNDASYTDYIYDEWNRLTRETWKNSGDSTYLDIQYSFDNAAGDTGNIYQKIVTRGGSPETTTFTYDAYNKLTNITYPDSSTETLTYDDNGQLTQRQKSTGYTTTYEWNDEGFLRKVTLPNAEEVEYSYDGAGRLTGRKCGSQEDLFVQSGWDIVSESDENQWRTYYTGVSMIDDSTNPKYFHYNHRGDTILVTDRDGNVIHDIYYEAYGTALNSTGVPLSLPTLGKIKILFIGSSGIIIDEATGLYYMRARWYSKDQIRFLSPDILNNINRYIYVNGNPINWIDPIGLLKITIDPDHTSMPIVVDDSKTDIKFKDDFNRKKARAYERARGVSVGSIPDAYGYAFFAKAIRDKYESFIIKDRDIRKNFRQNCHGYTLGGGADVYISHLDAYKILTSSAYNRIFDYSVKQNLGKQIPQLKSQLMRGDVVAFGNNNFIYQNGKIIDAGISHTATVMRVESFSDGNTRVWLGEREGQGAVYQTTLKSLNQLYPGEFDVYRPNENVKILYNGKKKIPYYHIQRDYDDYLKRVKGRCK